MDTTTKERLRRKRNLTFLALILLGGAVMGAWFISLESESVIGNVVGRDETPMTWTTTFENVSLDTRNEADNKTINATFFNEAGAIEDLTVNITEERIDVTDECFDTENDCVVEWFMNSDLVQNNDTVTALDGVNLVEYRLACRRFSCPGNVSGTFGLSE